MTDTALEKPYRCLSRLHWFARDRDLAWEHAWLAIQKLGGTDSAELAMAYSNLAQLRMVASDLPGTHHWTSRAEGAGSPAGQHGYHGGSASRPGTTSAAPKPSPVTP